MSDGWPNWRFGQVLRAAELRELESYLLAGAALHGDGAHGVTWLDTTAGLQVQPYQGALAVTVVAVAGLTPAGRPVCIGDPDDYRAGQAWVEDPQLPIQGVVPVEDMAAPVVLDLSVEVGREDPEETRKLAVRLRIVEAASPAPELDVGALYVGRYRWEATDPERLELLRRPLVHHLAALRPWDAAWEAWTGELHFRLRELVELAEASERPAAALEAWRLYEAWPELSWVALSRAWKRVQRLSQPDLEVVRPTELVPWRPSDASGELQPSRLVSHNHVEAAASAYVQWRLRDGVVIEGLLKPDYLQFWIVGDRRLPRGRLHLTFRGRPPVRVEIGKGEGHGLIEIAQNERGWFNLHALAPHLEHGGEAVLRGIGRVTAEQIGFRMA